MKLYYFPITKTEQQNAPFQIRRGERKVERRVCLGDEGSLSNIEQTVYDLVNILKKEPSSRCP